MTVAIRPRSQSDYKQPIKKKYRKNIELIDRGICIWVSIGRVNIRGHWRPDEMIDDDYDGRTPENLTQEN